MFLNKLQNIEMLYSKSSIHHLGVLNPGFRSRSKSKWEDQNLKTISEENSRYSKIGSMENSYTSKKQTSRIDIKPNLVIENHSHRKYNHQPMIPQINNKSSIVYIQNSPQKNTRIPPLNSPRHFHTNESSVVFINNRKFQTQSKSKSPSSCRLAVSPKRTVIRTISRQKRQINQDFQESRISRFPDSQTQLISQYKKQKQNLLRKIDILQKRVEEVHKDKQNSIINLLKENQILKEEIEKINKINSNCMQQSKYTDNLSQKMISLSELGEMDSLREANIKMSAQIQELTQKINEYSHPFKAIEKEKERGQKLIMKPIFNQPELILLPITEDQSSISQIINLHGQLSINSNPKNLNTKQVEEDAQYRQAQEIMANFNKMDEENSELRCKVEDMSKQIENKDREIREKEDKINELEEYVKTVNGFLRMDANAQLDKQQDVIDFTLST